MNIYLSQNRQATPPPSLLWIIYNKAKVLILSLSTVMGTRQTGQPFKAGPSVFLVFF